MLKREAKEIVVSLSNPQKMPCKSYGLPALKTCPVGKKLSLLENSICASCYADKGRYVMPNVKTCQSARLESIDNPLWSDAMVTLISGMPYFRWLDSGDIFSFEFLTKILEVIARTPETKHWIPTREKGLLSKYIASGGVIPPNVVIRLSAAMVDGIPAALPGLNTSSVHQHRVPLGKACSAPQQDGFCKDCRDCWKPEIANISYHKH